MHTRSSVLLASVVLAVSFGCGDAARPDESAASVTANLEVERARLVQPGAHLLLLGVTSDDYALYQEGAQVFATALSPHATRQWVADVPPGNTAFVYVVGKVAFCWTNPDRSVPGFGVSPLTVWSAASGPHQAAAASPIGTYATSASADGSAVLFPANGSADGTTGDLVLASTDLASSSTLAAGIPMGFPYGPCRPFAAFVGKGAASHPVALTCQPGDPSSATLADYSGGQRTELLEGVATPPFFSSNPAGTRFFTRRAGTVTPVLVSLGEAPLDVDDVPSGFGFFTSDSDLVYTARVAGHAELRSLVSGVHRTLAPNLVALPNVLSGSALITQTPASPDATKVPFATRFDPATGLLDMNLADTSGQRAPVTVEAAPSTYLFGPAFTSDSRFLLYASDIDFTFGTGTLYAASGSQTRAFTGAGAWSLLPAADAVVAFNDNPSLDFADFNNSSADLKVVDVSAASPRARLIAPAANLTFFVSHRGERVVFTTDAPGWAAGVYSASVD